MIEQFIQFSAAAFTVILSIAVWGFLIFFVILGARKLH
jgi:hypothetical protein